LRRCCPWTKDLICYDFVVETTIRQFPNVAPKTGDNFMYLTITSAFNELPLHRKMNSFANLKIGQLFCKSNIAGLQISPSETSWGRIPSRIDAA
jgi:hypothetical protein